MNDQDNNSEPVKYVRADRIFTGSKAEPVQEEKVCIIKEIPVLIDVEGIETYTILCTPADKRALTAGFLFTEGIINSMSDIKVLRECDDDSNTIRVRLKDRIPRIADTGRNLLIVSSCGACGSENLEQRIASLPNVGNKLRVEAKLLRAIYNTVHKQQHLFEISGGAHAAAVFDGNGKIDSFAEDTGRHNALDKAIGKCLLADIPIAGRGIALTSRLSLEMVSKCAQAGIEIITAVSAATSMAVDVADKCNITLCAFVRETRATVFTHPKRIIE